MGNEEKSMRKRISYFIAPQGSKRRFFARIVVSIFRTPKLMLRMINMKRIKNYFKYIKKEGMKGVIRRYEEALQLEMGYESSIVPFETEELVELKKEADFKALKKLVVPQFEKPVVSIILPAYNQFEYTYNCIKSIINHTKDVTYEIILADDCSTDYTTRMEEVISGVNHIVNKENLRFLLNCNNAAKEAKGEFILFLNNDTQVLDNWLEPLVRLMRQDEKIGMTGSKLVYPSGHLQEAGGIFWKDASAWNYGYKLDPNSPEFNYVKEADYISGASIMIRASLWKEIGGFDERFAPAYYEDSDLAFEVRKAGYKVVYQPASVVVHFEGISNGTDVTSGQKSYQVVNQQKFYEKWKEVLEKDHFENGQHVFLAKDRSRYKKQILIVDHYIPKHDKDAGGKCTYMYTKLFVQKGFKVYFMPDNFAKEEPYVSELQQLGVEVLYGNYLYQNREVWLRENAHYFDYIYLQRPHISIKYMDMLRECTNAKICYFAHDLHHIREYREYELTGDKKLLHSSQKWKKIEYELFEKTDVGHVVGSYEQEMMQKAFPNTPVRNIPLYIYEELPGGINKDFATRKDIMYVGGFGHPPNVDAVLWFGKEVFPKILKHDPDMKWYVVGSRVPLEIQELASDNIIITGFVPDEELERLYRECRMAVVPLRVGAGVKGKVVESTYFQIPLVTTTIGAEGLDTSKQPFVVVDDADEMANTIHRLYHDLDELYQMSERAKVFVSSYFMLKQAQEVIDLDFGE